MDHIDPRRLFELSQKDPHNVQLQLEEEERHHLRDCHECQQILAVLAREFDSSRPPYDHEG